MIGISALPTFYFDPTSDGRIANALIPDDSSILNEDRFPCGRFYLSLEQVTEKDPSNTNPKTVQNEFGNALKRAYNTVVRMQDDNLQPLPGCVASRTSMKLLDGWFYCDVHDREIVVGNIHTP